MYIRPIKNSFGAYPPPQSTKAPGLVELPEEFFDTYIEFSGFVELETDGEKIISLDPNTEAFETWKAEVEEAATEETEEKPPVEVNNSDIWEELDKAYNEGRDSAYDS